VASRDTELRAPASGGFARVLSILEKTLMGRKTRACTTPECEAWTVENLADVVAQRYLDSLPKKCRV